jgi:hypothetical protein
MNPLRKEKDYNSESGALKKRLPLLKSSYPKSLEAFNHSGLAIIDESLIKDEIRPQFFSTLISFYIKLIPSSLAKFIT